MRFPRRSSERRPDRPPSTADSARADERADPDDRVLDDSALLDHRTIEEHGAMHASLRIDACSASHRGAAADDGERAACAMICASRRAAW